MYNVRNNPGLGNFASFIKKVRKVVHKTMPREVSPTRMLEKIGSDNQKKAAKKSAAIDAQSVAQIAKIRDDALASLNSQVPASGLASQGAIQAATAAQASQGPPMPLILAGVAGLALIFFLKRKRK